MNRDPFAAIADPTRRQIIGLLAEHQPLSMGELAGHFDEVSRQAIGKQVRYLTESGLLEIKTSGRERYCYLHLEDLVEVYHWLAQYQNFWGKKLDQLGQYLDGEP